MNAENNKVVEANESQNANQTVDKSRRSFAKVGVVAPVIMTLTSKTALGSVYQCSISGVQSGNTSSHASAPADCSAGAGFSPGGWWQNASKSGNSDGNINQWCSAGINPFSIKFAAISPSTVKVKQILVSGVWKLAVNENGGDKWLDVYAAIKSKFGAGAIATSFQSIFGGGSSVSLWDMLDQNNGSLEWHAIADYLNALLFASGNAPAFASVYGGITPDDIVGLYHLAKSGTPFTSSTGTLISGNFNGGANGSGVLSYLIALHH